MEKAPIQLKPLVVADIPFGLHLKTLAGWNQIATDWEMLLNQSTGGSYLASYHGQKAGTVTSIQYEEKFSWIGMVLVDLAFRGLGIGTRLLQAAIDYARQSGPVLLDATPKGRKLYKTLGFEDVCGLERLEIKTLPVLSTLENEGVHAIGPEDMPKVIAYDAANFGAGRKQLLRAYHRNAPEYSFVSRQGERVRGYCLGRHGSHFEQIGPLMADNFSIALALFLNAALACRSKPLIVDVMSAQSEWRSYLLNNGFTVQRPFTRMRLGEWCAQEDRSRQFAIAGPEFG